MGAISNGMDIIEAVTAAGRPGLPLSQIVEQTGLPKSSVHRLLKEMVEQSLLVTDPDTRHYRGGLRLARIGAAVIADFDLRTVARPALQALHEATGQVATLGILDGDSGVYIDKVEPRDIVLRLHSEVGKRFPLHCTGLGKVLLAFADADTRKRVLKRKLDTYTPNTITDPKQLKHELNAVREQGYAVDREEITRGLTCVAAPIRGISGEVVGAMSCTMPTHEAEESGINTLTDLVSRAALAASAE